MSGENVCNLCRRDVCVCYVTLTPAQRSALAEADGLGYLARGAGRLKTARTLRDLGLVEIRQWNGLVTLTDAGRAFIAALPKTSPRAALPKTSPRRGGAT